jgi:hypothetical protein
MSAGTDLPHPDIDLSGNVTRFFRELVDDALKAQGSQATGAAESYVVALLADYAKPGQLSGETLRRPLTLLLDEAMRRSGHERFERLRSLGDGVLYVSGFFGDHLETRGVELDYVSTLGARAYDGAAAMLRHASSTAAEEQSAAPDVFAELAGNFRMFVQLVSRIAERLYAQSACTHGSMLKLYERWLKTGSDALADALAARGVVPVRSSGMLH